VVKVFHERYGVAFVTGILDQLLKESEPRIRIKGEAGRYIPRTKLLGVPRGCDGAKLLESANHLDRSEGTWELVELDEPDSIVFTTYRSSVSLTALIEQHSFTMNGMPAAERIQDAADPVIATLPAGRMTTQDARVASAYAEVCGLLEHDAEAGYLLSLENGPPKELGISPDEALNALMEGFGDVVHIYSCLSERLVQDGRALPLEFGRMARALTLENPGPLAGLYDAEALGRAIDEVKALTPFLQNVKPGRS